MLPSSDISGLGPGLQRLERIAQLLGAQSLREYAG